MKRSDIKLIDGNGVERHGLFASPASDHEKAASWRDHLIMAAFIIGFGLMNQLGPRRACVAQDHPQWVGNQSCATATCHGGVVSVGPAWHSSASMWESQDPHVHAGEVLFNELSERIVKALAPSAVSEEAQQHFLASRCASCHAPTALLTLQPPTQLPTQSTSSQPAAKSAAPASAGSDLLVQRLNQGVSCETCHGAASNWLVAHTRADWPSLPATERYSSASGMLNTEDLANRVDNCMRCHVGSRTADGIVRDMNHDMIAAGHPKLSTSIYALLCRMPTHWEQSSDALSVLLAKKGRLHVELPLEDRMVLAAVRLSLERTEQAKAGRDTSGDAVTVGNAVGEHPADDVPQPELSEYDCVACHRPYVANNQRPSRGLPRWQPELTRNVKLTNMPEFPSALGDELIWGRASLARFLSLAPAELDERSRRLLQLSPSVETGRGAR